MCKTHSYLEWGLTSCVELLWVCIIPNGTCLSPFVVPEQTAMSSWSCFILDLAAGTWNTSLQLLKLDCFFSGGEQGLSCIHACLILLSQASVTYLLCPASHCIPVAGLSLEKEYLKLFHSVCRTHLSSVNFVCLQLLILFWAQSTVFWWRNCILKTVNLIIS